jgi:polysaccharide transporter, PST family
MNLSLATFASVITYLDGPALISPRQLKNKIFASEDYKRICSNFISLTTLQAANYILPLLTLPYLIRVVGPEKFGLLAFATSLTAYFQILTDFGFNLSATRSIAINRDKPDRISEIYSSVMIIKIFLVTLSFLILILLTLCFDKFSNEKAVYLLSFGMVIGQTFFPVWVFQGLENMKYITILNLISRSVYAIAIFAVVHNVNDYIYVPILNSMSYLLCGIISLIVIHSKLKVRFYFQSPTIIMKYFKDSSSFFLSRVSLSIYTTSNIFVLGVLTNNTIVGYYSAAEKLYSALTSVYSPLIGVLYPYMSKSRNVVFFKKLFYSICSLNLFLCMMVFTFSDFITRAVFGASLLPSSGVLKIFSLVTIAVVPSILLGYPFLAAMGFPRYANGSVVIGSLVHFVGLAVLMYMSLIDLRSVAMMVLLTETIILLLRCICVNKNKLWLNIAKPTVV